MSGDSYSRASTSLTHQHTSPHHMNFAQQSGQQRRRPRSEPGASTPDTQFASYLGNFPSPTAYEQRAIIGFSPQAVKEITGNARKRMEARRQADRIANSTESPPSPTVSDMRRRFPPNQIQQKQSQSIFERSARSVAKSNSFDGSKTKFKSKFYEAAARQIQTTNSSTDSLSIGRSNSWKSSNADISRRSNISDAATASPVRSSSAYYSGKNRSPKRQIPLSPKSPTRGIMPTTTNGISSPRSRSPFIEERMRTFSQEPHREDNKHKLNGTKTSNARSPVQLAKYNNGKESTKKEENFAVSEIKNASNVDLAAKIAAVDRANPAEALDRIDSILREASQKKPDTLEIQKTDSDDGTSVSSITNPVFVGKSQDQNAKLFYNNATDPNMLLRIPDLQEPRAMVNPQSTSESAFKRRLENRHPDKKLNNHQNIKSLKKVGGHLEEKKEGQEKEKTRYKPSSLPSRRSHPWDDESQLNGEGQGQGNVIEAELQRRPKKPVKVQQYFQPIPINPPINASKVAPVTTTTRTPEQYKNTKEKSDNFDAAWASMSGPAAFPKKKSKSKKQRRKAGLSADDYMAEGFSVEVTYDSRGNANSTAKNEGFLRAFMRRQDGKNATIPSSQTVESGYNGSLDEHSGSHGSTGAQSAPTPKRSHVQSSRMVHPNAFPTHMQRGRIHRSRSLPRETSKSAETFRTASMAQKYSRVMRLYDDE